MSPSPAPAKIEEDSMPYEERSNSSIITPPVWQSPESAELPTEKLAEQKDESELTIQSSLQVLGGFMLLFNSYFDP